MNDGGPAFPVPGEPPVSTGDPRDGIGYGTPAQHGMSLRDWFAGQALAGMCALEDNRTFPEGKYENVEKWRSELYLIDAKSAYHYADAMLAARGKEGS